MDSTARGTLRSSSETGLPNPWALDKRCSRGTR